MILGLAITMITVWFLSLPFDTYAQATLIPDAHSRGYGYSPPRRRAPPDPHTFDYPASLKQYAEWFRYFYPQQAIEEDNADKAAEQEAGDGSKPRNGIKSKWEKYKKDFAATQVSIIISILVRSATLYSRFCTLSCLFKSSVTETLFLGCLVASNDV